jgi:hypothetical protein
MRAAKNCYNKNTKEREESTMRRMSLWGCFPQMLRNVYVDERCILWWDQSGQLWGRFFQLRNLHPHLTQCVRLANGAALDETALVGPVPLRVIPPPKLAWNETLVLFNSAGSAFPLLFPWHTADTHAYAVRMGKNSGRVPLWHIARGVNLDSSHHQGIDVHGHLHLWKCRDRWERWSASLEIRDRRAVAFVRIERDRHILFDDGSVGLPDSFKAVSRDTDLEFTRFALGRNLDSPIVSVMESSIYPGTWFIARTQSGNYYTAGNSIHYRSFYGLRDVKEVFAWWRIDDTGCCHILINNANDRIILFAHTEQRETLNPFRKTIHIPTHRPMSDICYCYSQGGLIVVIDADGLLYPLYVAAERILRRDAVWVTSYHLLASPLNPDAPVWMAYLMPEGRPATRSSCSAVMVI